MNTKNTIFATRQKAKIIQHISEIRGKEFGEHVRDFSKIFEAYFLKQSIEWKVYIEENELLFPENTPIQKNFLENFSKKILQFLQSAYNLGARFLQKQLQRDFYIDDIGAKEYANTRAWDLIKDIDETTKRRLQSIIAKWLQNGWNKQEMIAEIQKEFAEFGKVRASLIAQQETAMAHEYAGEKEFRKLAEEAGVTGWKRSQTQGDDRVRPSHRVNELAWWIEENTLFPWTGTMHAPHGFRCRCVTLRRLFEPEIDEKLKVHFEKVSLPSLNDEQKKLLLHQTEDIRRQMPYLPKFQGIQEVHEDNTEWSYIYSKWILSINPRYILLENYWEETRGILAHEFGHAVEDYFRNSQHPENKKIYGVFVSFLDEKMKDIRDMNSSLWWYPQWVLKWEYYPEIEDEETRRRYARSEFFAELLRYHFIWKKEIYENADFQKFLQLFLNTNFL